MTEIKMKNLFVCLHSCRLAFYFTQPRRSESQPSPSYSIHRHEARSDIDYELCLCKAVYSTPIKMIFQLLC
ncbi:unnamed protein product [Brassica rapa subsp. trilocularis]